MTPEAVVRSATSWEAVPFVPEIGLLTAAEPYGLWDWTERDAPPFWAFPWAGGQALARYILDHPGAVAGRRVFDAASGSGLVAIAAAKAGAISVVAGDVDLNAVAAIGINAAANDVAVSPRAFDLADGNAREAEVVLAADVFYQRELAELALRFLRQAAWSGADVLVADPGRAFLPAASLAPLASYQVPVLSVLEDAPVKTVAVYRLSGGLGRRDHDRAGGGDGDDRGVKDTGGGRAAGGLGPADDACFERQLSAAPPHRRDLAAHLQNVAGPHRGAELHVRVRGEQPLVTVHPHARLGRHVAEQPEHVRPVHQPAAVVRVAAGDITAVGDRQPDGHDGTLGASAWTR